MKTRSMLLILALGSTACGLAAAQSPEYPLTEAEVHQTLSQRGYSEVSNLEFINGMWEADATAANGNRVDIRIDPGTGATFPDERVSLLTENEVKARLSAAGFTDIHDVDFDDGLWTAEADDVTGDDREIQLDPNSGSIVKVEED